VPDHTVIARFRRRHIDKPAAVFTTVLRMCCDAGLIWLGLVVLDGTKVKADDSLDANRSAATVDEVHERRAEEFGLVRRRRFGRHRQAPARRRGEGIMPLDWLQHERGFASFSPAPNRSLANADTCAGRKPQESRRSPRSSRATRDPAAMPAGAAAMCGTPRPGQAP
jgi:hypothetical protein